MGNIQHKGKIRCDIKFIVQGTMYKDIFAGRIGSDNVVLCRDPKSGSEGRVPDWS